MSIHISTDSSCFAANELPFAIVTLSIFLAVAPVLGTLLGPVDPILHSHSYRYPGSWKRCGHFSSGIDRSNFSLNCLEARKTDRWGSHICVFIECMEAALRQRSGY